MEPYWEVNWLSFDWNVMNSWFVSLRYEWNSSFHTTHFLLLTTKKPICIHVLTFHKDPSRPTDSNSVQTRQQGLRGGEVKSQLGMSHMTHIFQTQQTIVT